MKIWESPGGMLGIVGLLIPNSHAEEKRIREGQDLQISVGDYQQLMIINSEDKIVLNSLVDRDGREQIFGDSHPKMSLSQGLFTYQNVMESDEESG